jgi:2-keto-3-deoxy-L-fuconate dehydrogenase
MAAERLGGFDIVVANAGIGAVGDVAANDDADRPEPSSASC